MEERRNRRSDQVGVALGYQLEACAERAGFSSMILADQDGLMVASSLTEMDKGEELAAILPLLAEGNDFAGVLLSQQAPGDHIVVSHFNAVGTDLFLCAVGNSDRVSHKEIARAKVGVRRILN